MAKSIKLKNETYLDSKSVSYKRKNLENEINAIEEHIWSYTPCKILNTPANSSAKGALSVLASQSGNLDGTYFPIVGEIIDANIGSYIGGNPNIATGGPNFQSFISGTTTLYTAIITNYSASYIVLLKRIYGNYYATYIGP